MPHEILGALIGVAAEGAIIGAGSDDKKNGCGCMVLCVLFIALICGLYYYCEYVVEPKPELKGIVTKKLPNNKVLVKTKTGEDVYTITNELYVNKIAGDSITINLNTK